MLASLERWLWKGTLELPSERFEVLQELQGNEGDMEAALGRQARELVAQIEESQAALERRLQALQPGATERRGPDPSEREVRQVAKALLPSLDALDRIIEFGESSENRDEAFDNWLTAVRALRTRLLKSLEGIGLVPVPTIGSEVDLEVHDVVAVVPAGEYPANTVVAERSKGYYLKGKLLRDAKVVVAQ